MSPRFHGIGGHHRARGKTDEWITPQFVIAALGGWESFDFDPCAPPVQPWPTARQTFTKAQNGLLQAWDGRGWWNPPYSDVTPWLARAAAHGQGLALIFARTEIDAWHRHVWPCAHGIFWFRGRLIFHLPDGSIPRKKDGQPQNAGAPSALIAYGRRDLDVLAAAALDGKFVALRIRPGVVVAALAPTWRRAIAAFMGTRAGDWHLDELYRAFSDHPKTLANPNYRAKIRQILQQGNFANVGRGLWKVGAA